VESGGAGPTGAVEASTLRNSSAAEQGIRQTLDVPGGYQYCLSVYARQSEESGARITLLAGNRRKEFRLASTWTRIFLTGSGSEQDESVSFGVAVPTQAVEICGLQVEAQPGPSGYKRTGAQGGVYTGARFKDDALVFSTDDLNHHSCRVTIIHAEHI